IKESQAGSGAKTDRGGSDLNLGAGVLIHPKIVAYGQRAVAHGIEPVAFATGLKRDGAFNSTDSPGASWRILFGLALIWRRALILILRLIGRIILVLRKGARRNLAKQQNCRRKYCKGKSCGFSHGVPH